MVGSRRARRWAGERRRGGVVVFVGVAERLRRRRQAQAATRAVRASGRKGKSCVCVLWWVVMMVIG
jgi:hypothetical protein